MTSIIDEAVCLEQVEVILGSVLCMLRAGVLIEHVKYREKYIGGN